MCVCTHINHMNYPQKATNKTEEDPKCSSSSQKKILKNIGRKSFIFLYMMASTKNSCVSSCELGRRQGIRKKKLSQIVDLIRRWNKKTKTNLSYLSHFSSCYSLYSSYVLLLLLLSRKTFFFYFLFPFKYPSQISSQSNPFNKFFS